MSDFDQSVYLTIAYDMEHYGVFSNGVLDEVNSARTKPPPGMVIGPLYPTLVLAVMKLSDRFDKAVNCSVETNHDVRHRTECEVYAKPMRLVHAFLLTLGVVAVALAAEMIFASQPVFWITGTLAALALLADAELFSFVMTESLTFAMYGMTMLALVAAWSTARPRYFVVTGLLLGLLCLTRTAFVVLAPLILILIVVNARFVSPARNSGWKNATAFALCFGLVIIPWALRNAVSVGKFGLTEEYGSLAMVERLAFNDMTPREYAAAFPYCLPNVGPSLVRAVFGDDAARRFEWNEPGSFFEKGRARRLELIAEYKRIDPMIGGILRDAMRDGGWWKHLMVTIPLSWCGAWVGGWLAFLLLPGFVGAAVQTVRDGRPLYLLYATPPFVMLALHGVLANHYTRYNLILIGVFAAGTAWLIARSGLFARVRSRWQANAPAA